MTSTVSATKQTFTPAGPYDLAASLSSGQAFCWRKDLQDNWNGWVGGEPVVISQIKGDNLAIFSTHAALTGLESYFGWSENLSAIWEKFPQDEFIKKARAFAPGLRLLRQDPWETTVNFICSSQKQIVQIMQINSQLRKAFGKEYGPESFSFPTAQDLARVGEGKIRECKLGYRAAHVARAAVQVANGEVDLRAIEKMETSQAREELMKLRGVGEKVANCILLFAYGRREAFPVDVWIERVLKQLYFPRKRKVSATFMREFAADYFGPYGGYTQLYLFHWVRLCPDALAKR